MKKILAFVLLSISPLFSSEIREKNMNATFVSPDAFLQLADFALYSCQIRSSDFDPKDVFEGAVVFVKPGMLGKFFRSYHPNISHKYILITHGGDPSSPGPFEKYLNDPKIIAWLARNPSIKKHNKLHPIPVGINRKNCPNPIADEKIIELQKTPAEKKHLLYLNINVQTNVDERQTVYELFQNEEFCYVSERVKLNKYLMDMKKSFFVLSPRGNGLDCFRTWEAILMGSIPIVQTSTLDPLLEDLPVLIIKDWNEINEEFLIKKYEIISKRTHNMEKVTILYWKKKIENLLKKAGISRKI